MRTVVGRMDKVVVVGAGLGGLSAALRLAAAGRDVTLLERGDTPGGRAGILSHEGYSFATGPTVLTLTELIDDLFACVGERTCDWLDLQPLAPAYRASFPDSSRLDVYSDVGQMAAEIERVCGPAESAGYLRFVEFLRRLYRAEMRDFIARNFDTPLDLMTTNLARLVALGAFRRLSGTVGSYLGHHRTRKVFSFQAMYAGMSPFQALAIYAVIAYMDSVNGVWFPTGGMHALPRALADVATAKACAFVTALRLRGSNCTAGAPQPCARQRGNELWRTSWYSIRIYPSPTDNFSVVSRAGCATRRPVRSP